jgi:hypothetical protein
MQRGLCGQLPFLTPDVTSCCCAPEAPQFYAGSQSYSADRSNPGWHGPHKGRRGREKKLCQQSRVPLVAVPLAAALLPLCAPGPTMRTHLRRKTVDKPLLGKLKPKVDACFAQAFSKFRRPRRPAPTRLPRERRRTAKECGYTAFGWQHLRSSFLRDASSFLVVSTILRTGSSTSL